VKRMLLAFLLVFGVILNWSMVLAADVYVESSGSCGGKTPCYSTIQGAINAANSGDTIKLAQGIYAETFVLDSDKQLILQGGWDAGFTQQTPQTTAIRAPIVTKGAIAFQELRIMEIAGPMGNAITADVLNGKTFSSDAGTGLIGTMPNRGGMNYTPKATAQAIAVGYYNGSGKVEGDANLVPGNIRSGVTIFGVAGNSNVADTSTGDAVAGEILKDKKAWVEGSEITGTRYGGCTCTGTLHGTRWCDNGDGTVTDLTTCLVWLKKADWGGRKPWRNASTDCTHPSYTCYDDAHSRAGILKAGTSGADLSDGSVKGDWRLPTKTELYGLANGPEAVRCVTPQSFTGVQWHYYWSSTTCESYPDYAWHVHMGHGYVSDDDKPYSIYVWPVRSGN